MSVEFLLCGDQGARLTFTAGGAVNYCEIHKRPIPDSAGVKHLSEPRLSRKRRRGDDSTSYNNQIYNNFIFKLFKITSSLNGNNGEWTNTDDVEENWQYVVCRQICGEHQHKKRAGIRSRNPAERRVAAARARNSPQYVNCTLRNCTANHYHVQRIDIDEEARIECNGTCMHHEIYEDRCGACRTALEVQNLEQRLGLEDALNELASLVVTEESEQPPLEIVEVFEAVEAIPDIPNVDHPAILRLPGFDYIADFIKDEYSQMSNQDYDERLNSTIIDAEMNSDLYMHQGYERQPYNHRFRLKELANHGLIIIDKKGLIYLVEPAIVLDYLKITHVKAHHLLPYHPPVNLAHIHIIGEPEQFRDSFIWRARTDSNDQVDTLFAYNLLHREEGDEGLIRRDIIEEVTTEDEQSVQSNEEVSSEGDSSNSPDNDDSTHSRESSNSGGDDLNIESRSDYSTSSSVSSEPEEDSTSEVSESDTWVERDRGIEGPDDIETVLFVNYLNLTHISPEITLWAQIVQSVLRSYRDWFYLREHELPFSTIEELANTMNVLSESSHRFVWRPTIIASAFMGTTFDTQTTEIVHLLRGHFTHYRRITIRKSLFYRLMSDNYGSTVLTHTGEATTWIFSVLQNHIRTYQLNFEGENLQIIHNTMLFVYMVMVIRNVDCIRTLAQNRAGNPKTSSLNWLSSSIPR